MNDSIRNISFKPKKKASKVLIKEEFDSTIQTSEQSKRIVDEMRIQIEKKEEEVNKLREFLARNNETDIFQAQSELNKLQNAFDKVVQTCEQKIEPIQNEYNEELSQLIGKKHFVDSIIESSLEREKFIKNFTENIKETIESIDDPDVIIFNDKPILKLVDNSSSIQSEIESIKNMNVLEKFTDTEFNKMNDFLKRQVKSAQESEQVSLMNLNSAKQDIEVRFSKPKINPIDEEWLNSKTELDFNELKLKEIQESINRLSDEAIKIENNNRNSVEQLRLLREELLLLNKYIPGENNNNLDGKNTRTELTLQQIESDYLKTRKFVLEKKLEIEKERLKPFLKQIEKLPIDLEKTIQKLKNLEINKNQIEIEISEEFSLKSELESEKLFGEKELEILNIRYEEQNNLLNNNLNDIEFYKKELIKQEKIMKLNLEINNLKTMDFDRFTTTVSKLINLKQQIDD